jgi:hypothetical protein
MLAECYLCGKAGHRRDNCPPTSIPIPDNEANLRVGMSTVPYTAMAVHLTVSIRPRTVPYVNHIHEFKSPRRYGTAVTTAGIRVMTAVQDNVV